MYLKKKKKKLQEVCQKWWINHFFLKQFAIKYYNEYIVLYILYISASISPYLFHLEHISKVYSRIVKRGSFQPEP